MSDKNNQTETAVAVPVNAGFFTIDKNPAQKAGPPQKSAGWVGIRSSKTGSNDPSGEKVAELEESGINVGDAYLTVDGTPIAVSPFQFHLLKIERLWTAVNAKNVMVDASATPPEDPKASPLKEVLFCVFAVKLPNGGYKAATGKFRGPQARGIGYVQQAMDKMLADPTAYGNLSATHKRALDARQSLANGGGVILSKLWATEEEGPNGDYVLTKTKCYPNPDPDAFNRWFLTEMQPGGELQAAARFHNKNVGEVRDLIAGKVTAAK